MNILIVLSGEVLVDIKELVLKQEISYIVAVDGGYDKLIKQKVFPNITIGDFDSITENKIIGKTRTLNKEKDHTDFEETLNYLEVKFNNINLIYVIGFMANNRPEHFYNNLNLIRENITFISNNTQIRLLLPDEHKIRYEKYISFFALDKVEDLTLKGFKYPLEHKTLNIRDTLCISNELVEEEGLIIFSTGKLLMFLSTD